MKHFGGHAHGNVRTDSTKLAAGEYLTSAGGRFGNICDQLWFRTSQGREFYLGGQGGSSYSYDTSSAHKPYIIAFGVGMGGHVHHAKCFYIDLDRHA